MALYELKREQAILAELCFLCIRKLIHRGDIDIRYISEGKRGECKLCGRELDGEDVI